MTKVMIEDYNTSLDSLKEIMESCSNEERPFIESAIKNINQAKLSAISSKIDDANILYENGELTETEYENFMEYMNDEGDAATVIVHPYMTEAALSISAALAASETKAFNSKKYNAIMSIENGKTFGTMEKTFIHSRLKKFATLKNLGVMPNKLKKSLGDNGKIEFSHNGKIVIKATVSGNNKKKNVAISSASNFSDSVYKAYVCASCGIMTSTIKSELKSAKEAWAKNKTASQKAIKEYVEEVWEESGDFSIIKENLNKAIDEGKTSHFAAQFFTRVADGYEMSLYAKGHK